MVFISLTYIKLQLKLKNPANFEKNCRSGEKYYSGLLTKNKRKISLLKESTCKYAHPLKDGQIRRLKLRNYP